MKEILDKFFKKYPGSNFAIAGGFLGIFSVAVSSILHYIDEPFKFAEQWVSNNGVTAAFGASYIQNIGLFIAGLLFLPAIIRFLQVIWAPDGEENRLITNIFALISTISGLVAVWGCCAFTIFNMRDGIFWHGVGAIIFFNAMLFVIVNYTITGLLAKKSSTGLVLFSIVTFIPSAALVGMTLYTLGIVDTNPMTLQKMFALFLTDPVGLFDILANFVCTEGNVELYGNIRILEWISATLMLAWFVRFGSHSIKYEKEYVMEQSE